MSKIRVFADTNVILESFRTGCWAAISSHFAIETVQKCVEETLTGNPADSRHVAVLPADLNAGLAGQHPVTRKELATLILSHPPSSPSTTARSIFSHGCLPTSCCHRKSSWSQRLTRLLWSPRTGWGGWTA
jgi:hypothetical protein